MDTTMRRQSAAEAPQVGMLAPDFTLAYAPGRAVTLRDLRGHPVVLILYAADWHPVCSEQLALYQAFLPLFGRLGAAVVGLSGDSVWCHGAFARAYRLTFPLLADVEPTSAVRRSYGLSGVNGGIDDRALVVVDAAGIIRWRVVTPIAINPGVEGALTALEALHTSAEGRGAPRGGQR